MDRFWIQGREYFFVPSAPAALLLQLNHTITMAHWLVKSEPSVYGWEQFVKDKETSWDGVRNYAARLHLRAMKKGDTVLYYHSNEGMEIVGIATVSKEAYQDPTTDDERWVSVRLKAGKRLKHPVSLDTIKQDKQLKDMALVRISRLSVQPVTEEEWAAIRALAGEK
jgi:predicted RNA-binding protein with PUA-like domain